MSNADNYDDLVLDMYSETVLCGHDPRRDWNAAIENCKRLLEYARLAKGEAEAEVKE